jgi:hypothetical protein
MVVLWPAFLMAGVLELLVFALVDPTQLHWLGGAPLNVSPPAVYTGAFFLFWAVIAGAAVLTQVLERASSEVNRLRDGEAPPQA